MASANRLTPGDDAPRLQVQTCDGQQHALPSYWAEQPLVLALTRQLGCAFCRQQLVELRDHYADLQRAGLGVVAAMMRDAGEVARLRDKLQLPFDCLADPRRELYRAFAAPRAGLWNVMGTHVWGPAIRAIFRGGIGRVSGDVRQLQSTFVIDQQGRILLAHYPQHSADHPLLADLIRAVEERDESAAARQAPVG